MHPLPDAELMPEELRAAIVLFASLGFGEQWNGKYG